MDQVQQQIDKCFLCNSKYEYPKLLNCLHIFCKKCLQLYVKESEESNNSSSPQVRIKCPICEKNTSFLNSEADGINGLRNVSFYSCLQQFTSHSSSTNNTITNGQSPACLSCSIDNRHDSAVVKCLDCLDNLCKKCTKSHTLTALTRFHKLVLMSDLSVDDIRNVCKSDQIACLKHPKEVYKFFCSDCQLAACIDCRLTNHHQHDCVALESVEMEERKRCENSLLDLQSKLNCVRNSIDRAKLYEIDLQFFASEAESQLENEANEMILLVHKFKKEALQKLSAARSEEMKTIEKFRNRMSNDMKYIQHAVRFCQLVLDFASPYDVVALSNQLSETSKNFLQQSIDEPSKSVLTIESLNPPIERPIGQLKRLAYPYSKLLKSCDLKCGWITSIVSTNDEIFLISDDTKDIRVLSKDMFLKKVIKTSAYKAHQLAIFDHADGRIIVTESESKRICIISTIDYGCKIFANSKLSSPCGITVSQDDRQLVYVSDTEENCIIVYDKNGNRLNVIKHEKFKRPWYLTIDDKNRLLICDHKSDTFLMLTNQGEFINEFGKLQGNGYDQLWFPAAVVVDRRGNILLADNWNHRIVVLASNGEFKCHLITRSDGLLYPRSLAIDPISGNLYIGQDNGEIKLFQYYA